jgi:uncharacterized damage-inducible protein DinB
MSLSQSLLPEFENEMKTTRRLLERVPDDRFTWQPHAKSTPFGKLATHLANIPRMVRMIFSGPELDPNPPGGSTNPPRVCNDRDEVLAAFDEHVAEAKQALAGASDEECRAQWVFKNRGQVIFTLPRIAAVRTLVMSHVIHHRGQMSVYLRLNEIPVPSIYGPSADESGM